MSDTATYSEFPITMTHPHFQPSKPVPIPGTQVYNADGTIARQDYRGTPERYPPVTALNADAEERLKADGYERAGKIDPAAWVRAHADAPPADYKPAEFPKWVDGVLYQSAAEVPGYVDDGRTVEPEPDRVTEEVVHQPTEAENLRAQMAQMNDMMARMQEQMQAQAKLAADATARAEAAEARAKASPPQQQRRPPGRPRKTA